MLAGFFRGSRWTPWLAVYTTTDCFIRGRQGLSGSALAQEQPSLSKP